MPLAIPWTAARRMRRLLARIALAAAAALATGCVTTAPATLPATPPAAPWPDRLQALLPADVLLLGEQHDAPEHQRLQREAVQWLAARGLLAAVVLEMAESGHSTRGLPRDATEAQAQAALQWNDAAWPWKAYGPVVMAAVAAGVPVLGGNLPRSALRATLAQEAWDQHLPAPALQRQYQALRDGHCGLLPEAQIAPMARVQIARDARMARTAQEALQPGQTVLLIAGAGHVLRSLGVPTHWPERLRSKVLLAQAGIAQAAIKTEANAVVETPPLPPGDPCEALRQPR
ncbi:ChaN family lipoprotein [Acidovorax sp.]|uniref:ChaN family lipoprotein n=1 Tax=Acidovorax sp. TaxID=1872122 RepID=UPI0025C679E8|nr:ChaN family lipoprotein [Acidovorax sp.]